MAGGAGTGRAARHRLRVASNRQSGRPPEGGAEPSEEIGVTIAGRAIRLHDPPTSVSAMNFLRRRRRLPTHYEHITQYERIAHFRECS